MSLPCQAVPFDLDEEALQGNSLHPLPSSLCVALYEVYFETQHGIYIPAYHVVLIFFTILWEILRSLGFNSFGNAILIINKCAIYDFISSKCEELFFTFLHSSTGRNRSSSLSSS